MKKFYGKFEVELETLKPNTENPIRDNTEKEKNKTKERTRKNGIQRFIENSN